MGEDLLSDSGNLNLFIYFFFLFGYFKNISWIVITSNEFGGCNKSGVWCFGR